MEGQKIIKAITNLFKSADEHDWQLLESVLAPSVWLDSTSMKGGEASMQTPDQIRDAWAMFLPGFDKTHHLLSAFRVQLNGENADVNYSTTANHILGDEHWTIIATYLTKLEKQNGTWLITYHQINYESQSGNVNLPKKAHQIMAERVGK